MLLIDGESEDELADEENISDIRKTSALVRLKHTNISQPRLGNIDRNAGENIRCIKLLTYWLKKAIYEKNNNPKYSESSGTLPPPKILKLLAQAHNYIKAYADLETSFTTPLPFPLVQMARTFLFVWLAILPFAILDSIESKPAAMMIMFMVSA